MRPNECARHRRHFLPADRCCDRTGRLVFFYLRAVPLEREAAEGPNRYSFVLYDLSPFQWQQLADTAVQAVGQCLHLEGFSAPQVDRYLALAGSAAYTKTHGRREVAFLNRAWFFCLEQELAVDTGRQLQTGLMELCNTQPCRCAGHPGLGVARTRFWQDLAALGLRR